MQLDKDRAIKVDPYSRTTVDNIWAVGDVTNRMPLTPAAIMEGMAFAATCFGNKPTRPVFDKVDPDFALPEGYSTKALQLCTYGARGSAVAASANGLCQARIAEHGILVLSTVGCMLVEGAAPCICI